LNFTWFDEDSFEKESEFLNGFVIHCSEIDISSRKIDEFVTFRIGEEVMIVQTPPPPK